MKSSITKYIFIVFVIAIIIAVIYKVNDDKKNQNVEEEPKTTTKEEIVKDITLGVAEFDTINPILSKNKHIQEISKIIYEPLLELDEEYKLQNCLAKDWAKTSATTYLIKIRDDIIGFLPSFILVGTITTITFKFYNLELVQDFYPGAVFASLIIGGIPSGYLPSEKTKQKIKTGRSISSHVRR